MCLDEFLSPKSCRCLLKAGLAFVPDGDLEICVNVAVLRFTMIHHVPSENARPGAPEASNLRSFRARLGFNSTSSRAKVSSTENTNLTTTDSSLVKPLSFEEAKRYVSGAIAASAMLGFFSWLCLL